MLGSTLISTAIHFLITLFALLAIFPSARAKAAAGALKSAQATFKECDQKNSGYSDNIVSILFFDKS